MKFILVMLMLATVLSSMGCASRRAAAREAKAAKIAKAANPAPAVAQATKPVTAPAQSAEAAVNTYAVSAIPASTKSAAVVPVTKPAEPVVRAAEPVVRAAEPVAKAVVQVAKPAESVANVAETGVAPKDYAIEKVPFQIGISSVTVERLAQGVGCVGGKGAGLVTEKGPVEVYRMQCENGKTFLAKCELRQCSPLRW